jgi:hypothetical protein
VLWALVRADFLERVRRHSFLVTLGFTLWAAYMFLPPNHSTYATLNLQGHRGIYNSAWVATVVSLLAVSFLSLAGFYLVKNAVERDRHTGVGQILAATPLPTPLYLLGKMLSNLAVLATMLVALAMASAVMQGVRGEDTHLDVPALLTPFVLVTLPTMALVAAVAVAFEVIPWFRGGAGNVVYFFFWITSLSLSSVRGRATEGHPLGVASVIPQMQAACARAFPEYGGVGAPFTMGFNIKGQGGVWDMQLFEWHGADWTPGMVGWRILWLSAAITLTLAMSVFFDRFDAAPTSARRGAVRGRSARRRGAPGGARNGGAIRAPPSSLSARSAILATRASESLPQEPPATAPTARFDRLVEGAERSNFGALVVAELRIMFKGITRWWWIVTLGFVATGLFVPIAGVHMFVAPMAMIWPLLLWSPLGTREVRHRTDALLFSTPRPVGRLLAAQWLTGVVVALTVAAGPLVRFVLMGEGVSALALLAGVVFAPSMALALGTWTGTAKAFEVLYLLVWYSGPMNRIPPIDFVGSSQPAAGPAAPLAFIVASAALVMLAVLGRRRHLRR